MRSNASGLECKRGFLPQITPTLLSESVSAWLRDSLASRCRRTSHRKCRQASAGREDACMYRDGRGPPAAGGHRFGARLRLLPPADLTGSGQTTPGIGWGWRPARLHPGGCHSVGGRVARSPRPGGQRTRARDTRPRPRRHCWWTPRPDVLTRCE